MNRLLLPAFILLIALVPLLPNHPAYAGSYFPETNHSLNGAFLDYWIAHGGLAQFGYPITDEINENGRTIQYLERAVFEFWPENPDPYKVQLRLLGNILATGRENEQPFQSTGPVASSDTRWYFSETGHTLGFGFLTYWQGHGALDIYGYPISEEFLEVSPTDGKTYTVQYFQRNRFEYHPENKGTQYETLLGLLGSEYYRARTTTPPAQPGTILYQADWSGGLAGWPGAFGWSTLNGMLLNDGSYPESYAASGTKWIAAPYQPPVADYVVEADIQSLGGWCGGLDFGIVVRGGYIPGVVNCGNDVEIWTLGEGGPAGDRVQFSPGRDWHTYRIEAKGNNLRILVDGALVLQASDNRYLSPGSVGLWSGGDQLSVRTFKVIAL